MIRISSDCFQFLQTVVPAEPVSNFSQVILKENNGA